VKLIGVFPEGQVTMPKINPTQKYPNQLANGHTHLFMLTGKQLAWGSEARVKFELAKILAKGDRETARINPATGALKPVNRDPSCKTICIVLGDCDISEWIEDVRIAVQQNLPIILVKGSKMCDAMIDHINGKAQIQNQSSP
jgi:SLOG in TRPM, prokaryote